MAEETATAQAARLLRLLWRRSLLNRVGSRGPKQTVSIDAVIAAGIAIADRDGYAQVSIRTVAAELGLRPMSLYTYVPSKDALIALMVDTVAERDEPIATEPPMRDRMTAIARQIRDELICHPWLLEAGLWRPILGPARSLRYERQLAALDGVGLSDLEMDQVIATLTAFATGNAQVVVAATRSRAQMTDAQWWEINGPLLAEVMPAERFPVSSRVGAVVGELYQGPGDPDGAFEYGLARLLDGLTR